MRVFIGNSELELKPRSELGVTLQGDNLEQVGQSTSSFTTEFSFPMTHNNEQIIGQVNALQEGVAYTGAPDASIQDNDGRVVLNNGVFQVEELNDDEGSGRVVSGAVEITEALGELTLQDFALNELVLAPVAKTEANIVANINNAYTSYYSWASADFGNDPNGSFADLDTLFPFVYYHRILTRIIANAGYSLDTTAGLPTNSFFRECALAYSGSRFNEESYFAASLQGFITTGGAVTGYQNLDVQGFEVGADLFSSFNYYSPKSSRAQIHEIYINWEIDLDGTGNWRYKVRLYDVTDLVQIGSEYDSGAQSGTPSTTITDSFRLYIKTGDLDPTHSYILQVDAETALNFEVLEGYWRNDDGRDDYTSIGGATPPSPNLYVQPPTDYVFDPLFIMPDMRMADFFEAVLNQFSARVLVNDVTGEVVITRRDDDLKTFTGTQNLTSKINPNNTFKREFYFGDYGRENLFLYDNDDELSELAGSGAISITNVRAQDEYEVVKLPFSYSLSNSDGAIIPVLGAGVTTVENELNPRCVYLESVSSPNITVGSTSVSNYKKAFVRKLAWSAVDTDASGNISNVGLIDTQWSAVRAILQRIEKTTLAVRLTALDFETIDLFAPYYIEVSDGKKSISGYFALVKVDQYQGGGVADVEFVNLNVDLQ